MNFENDLFYYQGLSDDRYATWRLGMVCKGAQIPHYMAHGVLTPKIHCVFTVSGERVGAYRNGIRKCRQMCRRVMFL